MIRIGTVGRGRRSERRRGALHRVEDAAASLCLLAMAALPLFEIVSRRLVGVGFPGSTTLVRHLTLWVALLGAGIAAREGRLLAVETFRFLREGQFKRAVGVVTAAIAAGVSTLLAVASIELVQSERGFGLEVAGGIPAWVMQLVLPFAFALIAARLVLGAGAAWSSRLFALAGPAFALVLVRFPELIEGNLVRLAIPPLLLAGLLGAPLFAVLGGLALLLFMSEGVTPAAVVVETYALTISPTLAAIPLFSLAGFLLSEGKAPERLLRLFRALFGWMPGGTAIIATLLSAFFTVFTGGSGVTILALGGLLFPVLLRDGYRERFSLGLLTGAGSLGLLFPPALPLILYAVISETPVEDLFLGGFVPGTLLILLVTAFAMREGSKLAAGRTKFELGEAGAAIRASIWEILLPVAVLGAIFSGWATIVEAAAVAALLAFISQTVVHRDVSVRRDLLRIVTECAMVIGGVLLILGVAVGLTGYLVQADTPSLVLAWTQQHVQSRWAFLLMLNVFLLLVGSVMDIFSATAIVVPLLLPLGAAFGIHPVHLGIIFVANLELGYMTPPVGLNLFLASYRFERPLLEIYRACLPILLLRGIGVLLITYLPWLTLGLLDWLGR